MGIEIRSATLRAQGQFDARGTLGVSRETPVGCTGLSITTDVMRYEEGGINDHKRSLPGRSTVGDITLKQGIALPNGQVLCALAQPAALKALDALEGAAVSVQFSPSNVLLGTPA
jgi:hypothetical protein